MGSISSVSCLISDVSLKVADAKISRLAEDYNLEQLYRKPFADIWKEEQDSAVFGPLSERMGVRGRDRGPLLVNEKEMEAASMIIDRPC